MKMTPILVTTVAIHCLSTPMLAWSSTDAPPAAPDRLLVGAAVNTATLRGAELPGSRSGTGVEVSLGYAFSPRLAVLAATSGARVDDSSGGSYTLGHFDLLARGSLRAPDERLLPHLSAGLSRLSAPFGDPLLPGGRDARRDATTATLGVGLDYRFATAWSLSGSVKHSTGSLGGSGCPGAADRARGCADSTRVTLGVHWYPWSR